MKLRAEKAKSSHGGVEDGQETGRVSRMALSSVRLSSAGGAKLSL